MANGYAPTPLFEGERVRIGLFVARPGDPWVSDCGPARGHLVVFPRFPVRITHAGEKPIVADPTRVMFYNRGQEYRRDVLSREGDRCLWLAFQASDVADSHPRPRSRPSVDERPFDVASGPGDARSFFLQRLLCAHLASGQPASPLLVEELAMHLLHRVVANAHGSSASAPSNAHADLAERLRVVVHGQLERGASLASIARGAGVSPFHAARIFKRHTGLTLHGYLDALRLCRALERLVAGERDLTALALDVGYASHSHFTFAFGRRFGVPPSEARSLALGARLSDLRRLLSAMGPRAGF